MEAGVIHLSPTELFGLKFSPPSFVLELHFLLKKVSLINYWKLTINYDVTRILCTCFTCTTAQRCCSETGKVILDLFSSVVTQFKKYHPSGNLKFNNSHIFQSLKFRILIEKNLSISLKLNLTPNTLANCGLNHLSKLLLVQIILRPTLYISTSSINKTACLKYNLRNQK